MIRHRAPVERWDTTHGVDHVPVESREEPESVLAGQAVPDRSLGVAGELLPASAVAVIGNVKAARLTSRNVSSLQDDNLKAALDQLAIAAGAKRPCRGQGEDRLGDVGLTRSVWTVE